MARRRAQTLGLGWLGSLTFSTILGSLLFVIFLELRQGSLPASNLIVGPDCSHRLAELTEQIAEVTERLRQLGLPLPAPVEEMQGAGTLRWVHRRYEVGAPPALSLATVEERLQAVVAKDPCVSVIVNSGNSDARVQIGVDGLLTHTLVVRWVASPLRRTRVAIVIEDLGDDLRLARQVAEIQAPIAFAVDPVRPFAREVAELAKLFGREVILLPTTARPGDDDDGGPRVVAIDSGENEVHDLLDQAITAVPHVVGLRYPAVTGPDVDQERMAWMLAWLKLHALYWLSDGEPHPSIRQLAAALAIPIASRTLILDAEPRESVVREQFAALVALARQQGPTIGIGHPYPATLEALATVLPEWGATDVEVVPVSTLAVVPTLAAE
jgi:polysaccharide deacetylase 2 family uncharacterized protein YibQ